MIIFKKSVSPVIAVILLLSITVVISVLTLDFSQDYFNDSQQQIDTSNLILSNLNNKEIYSTLNSTILQIDSPSINISAVVLDGTLCSGVFGFFNNSYITLNISSCSGNLSTLTPLLTIEKTDGSLLQFTLNINTGSSSILGTNKLSLLLFNLSSSKNASTVSASFLGANANDWLGWGSESAGDVNGDGYDDILAGSPDNDDGGSNRGKVYLILGNSSGFNLDMSVDNVSSASFYGEANEDFLGYSTSAAGDVNGDGYDDILIGSDRNDFGGNNAGKAYLIFGSSSGWSLNQQIDTVANSSFHGERGDDWLGSQVAGVGDVNGDGYDDMLIGSYSNDGGTYIGKGYLIFGQVNNWGLNQNISAVANSSFYGEKSSDFFSVISSEKEGDLNGDGFNDLLIGANGNDQAGDSAGKIYIVYGKSSGWVLNQNISSVANASFTGEQQDQSLWDLEILGDVNNDGYDDIHISAGRNDEGGNYSGQSYVVFGQSTPHGFDQNLSSADMSFQGQEENERLSSLIALRINRDNYLDFIIGGYRNDEGGIDSGKMYVVLGNPNRWIMDQNISEVHDYSFIGERSNDRFGTEIHVLGDINGDGYDDFATQSVRNDEGGSNAGQIYIMLSND